MTATAYIKTWYGLFLVIFIMWLVVLAYWPPANAQTTSMAWQVTVTQPHTTCLVTPSTTSFCFASDGLWQSINGTPYVQLTPGAAAGVTSVNGKTGAVTITASTTLQ